MNTEEESAYRGIYTKDYFIKSKHLKFVLEEKLKIKVFININARFQDIRSCFITINETTIILGNITLYSLTLHIFLYHMTLTKRHILQMTGQRKYSTSKVKCLKIIEYYD